MTNQYTYRRVSFIASPRVCPECGAAARCESSFSDSSHGIPGGTEYRFHCVSCGQRFSIDGWGRLVFALVFAPVLFIGGATSVLNANQTTGLRLLGLLCASIGLGLFVQQAKKLMFRLKTPVVKER